MFSCASAAWARHLPLEHYVGHPNVDGVPVILLKVLAAPNSWRIDRPERLQKGIVATDPERVGKQIFKHGSSARPRIELNFDLADEILQ
jgi:hypothetical protein